MNPNDLPRVSDLITATLAWLLFLTIAATLLLWGGCGSEKVVH